MNDKRDLGDKTEQIGSGSEALGRKNEDIGTGKKVGLYGCGLLILGFLIVVIAMILTGIYNPFEGTEGVGP